MALDMKALKAAAATQVTAPAQTQTPVARQQTAVFAAPQEPLKSSSIDALYASIMDGDLQRMTKEQRLHYYREFCERLGLNPLSKPFGFFEMQGGKGKTLTMYALKEATNQLARRDSVSVEIKGISYDFDSNVMQVDVRASSHDFHNSSVRITDEIGCVAYAKGLTGDLAANQRMKCITKAKRRAILSHCGLGIMDETEVETVKGRVVSVEEFLEAKDLVEPKKATQEPKEQPKEEVVTAEVVQDEHLETPKEETKPPLYVADAEPSNPDTDFDCTKPADMDWLVRSIKSAFTNPSRALVVPLAECLKGHTSRSKIIAELAELQKEPASVEGYVAARKKK